MKALKELIRNLYYSWSANLPDSIIELPASGSSRKYFRIFKDDKTIIAAYNTDKKENEAFLYLSEIFGEKGLNVPKIYFSSPKDNVYFIQDLGDETLYSYIKTLTNNDEEKLKDIYKEVLEYLPEFQISAAKEIDFSLSYPRYAFDKQSMMWDMNYFKYYFLKLNNVDFDEQKLEDDFIAFSDFLLKAKSDYFLYRDFQSRNIMLHDYEIYFIDYQGGRKGPLQYDIASLLYDAKAGLSEKLRLELMEYYLDFVSTNYRVDKEEFMYYYYGFVYIRIIQALGAYGFRGLYEKKEHFLQSIPYAKENLRWLLQNKGMPIKLPELERVLNELSEYKPETIKSSQKLTLEIISFSYKKGIPQDKSEHGGGYIFDCRALPNPGRFEEYKQINGRNAEVIEYLHEREEVINFLKYTQQLVELSLTNYIERKFDHLMVCYGCTGGQHRSVYCAEYLNKYLEGKYDIVIDLKHRELGL